MAALDLSACTPENLDTAETFEVAWIAAHAIGKVVKPSGAVVSAIADHVGGVIIRVGDAKNKSLVMRRGILRGVSGVAVNTAVYSKGDATAEDTKPAGAAGTQITRIGVVADSTDRLLLQVTTYEKGA